MRMKIPEGFEAEAFRCHWVGIDRSTNKWFDRVRPFVIFRADTNLKREREQFNEFFRELGERGFVLKPIDPKNLKDHEIDIAFVGGNSASKEAAYSFAKRLLRYVLRVTVLYGVSNYHPLAGDFALFDTELGTRVQLRMIDSRRFVPDCLCHVTLFLSRRDSDLFLIGVVNAATTYLDSHTQTILNKIDRTNIEPYEGRYGEQKTRIMNLSKSQPKWLKFIDLADHIHDARKMHVHRQVAFLSSIGYFVADAKRATNRYNKTTQAALNSSKHPAHEYDYDAVKLIIRDAKRAVRLTNRLYAGTKTVP